MNFSSEGSTSLLVSISAVIISLLTVLIPILAKRMAKMAMTTTEIIPPVVEVYSVSPLYLINLLEGKRSTVRKALLAHEKNDGIICSFRKETIYLYLNSRLELFSISASWGTSKKTIMNISEIQAYPYNAKLSILFFAFFQMVSWLSQCTKLFRTFDFLQSKLLR